jgi:short-subunit dehydrogenase
MMNNKKKHVLITGASSGIGKATASLLRNGHTHIHAVGRSEEALKILQTVIGADHCTIYQIDLRSEVERNSLERAITQNCEHIDWIIHCAGFIDPNESTLIAADSMRQTFETNTYAPIILHSLLLPHMQANGGVVFVSSTAGIWGSETFPIYSASKAAINMYAQSIARMWAQTLRTSITLCPGATNTPMRERARGDADQHQSPEIVAATIVKIILGESSYKNGDVVIVRDGVDSLYQSLK